MEKTGVRFILLGSSFFANAGLITIGALTLDQAGDSYVKDSLNGLDWLRWDEVKTLNYSQIVTELAPGGTYDGWRIARNDDANLFIDALFSGWHADTCNSTTLTENCWTGSSPPYDFVDFTALLGISYDATPTYNFAWFLSDNGGNREVGYIEIHDVDGSEQITVHKNNEWSSFTSSDNYSASGVSSAHPIGFQLVRDSFNIPEPSSLAILTLGIIGLASRRFKKQS